MLQEKFIPSISQVGKNVLNQEANALIEFSKILGDTFEKAVDLIHQTQGRLIVSGVGKSGHVGKKIAATFASTGQPSFFVHAAEAGHGDLGMITQGDTLLLISYSGEASELTSVLHYAHRFHIPIVAITGKENSTLAKHASVTICLPSVGEACPLGLAPTTSTTLTMALGDALAVALLTMRGFTKNDFHVFHPGGNLGHQLRLIKDFMHTGDRVPLVGLHCSMAECLVKMSAAGFGCVGIIDDENNLLGVITDGDLRRHMQDNILNKKVADIMTLNPITIDAQFLMADALALFEKKSISALFVVETFCERKKVIGILHLHDCLKMKAF